jgi:cupin fold WbuC family metalloprotein
VEGSTIDRQLMREYGLTEREPGILTCRGEVARADRTLIDALKRYAGSTTKGRARILFHGDESDGLHEMMIAAPRMTLWPPHINEGSAKSWTVLDGEIAFVQYAAPGDITAVRRLAADGVRGAAFFRLSAERWHTIVPLSEMPVFIETRRGPHLKTRFADWGPQTEDHPDMEALRQAINALDADR